MLDPAWMAAAWFFKSGYYRFAMAIASYTCMGFVNVHACMHVCNIATVAS